MDAPLPTPRPYKPIVTPCVLVCVIDPRTGWCLGCWRTNAEIEAWRLYSDEERAAIMAELKGRKEKAK